MSQEWELPEGEYVNEGEVRWVRIEEESNEGWLHVCTEVGWETTEAYLPPHIALELGEALVKWAKEKKEGTDHGRR